MNRRTEWRLSILLGATAWIAAGCVSPAATPSPPPTETAPTEAPPSEPTATLAPHPSWIDLRDPVYDYGIAVPCWWWVSPTPPGGVLSAMTLHSYDEAYFQENSTKGWWNLGDYPPGVVKMDVGGWPLDDPSLSTVDAAVAAFTSDEQEVTSAQAISIGRNAAADLQTRSTANPDNVGRMIVFRLRPDTLLFVSAYPLSAFETPDVQGILESLSLTSDQPVVIPAFPPSQPLIELPNGCPAP